jgi:hypothetical protein
MPNVKLSDETHAAIQKLQRIIVLRGVDAVPKSVRELAKPQGAQLPMDRVVAAAVELLRLGVEGKQK